MNGISEPVRFLVEAKARIRESNDSSTQDLSETIWSSFKKPQPFAEEFDLMIKQVNLHFPKKVSFRTKIKLRLHRTILVKIFYTKSFN